MLLVDTEEKKIIQDVELKLKIAQSRPHSQWLKEQVRKTNIILFAFAVRMPLKFQIDQSHILNITRKGATIDQLHGCNHMTGTAI